MKKRWVVVVALAAAAQLPIATAAHAQASWPPLQPTIPPPAPFGPRVILRSDRPNARLQQHTQLRWRDICLAPCGATVDPSALYRVGGGSAIASEPFSLPRASGDVYVDAQVGSKASKWVGLGLMIGGLVAAGYGLLFWQMSQSFDNDPYYGSSQDTFPRNLAYICFGVGGVLEAVGLPLFLSSTSVQVR